jgi:hypothetical protein
VNVTLGTVTSNYYACPNSTASLHIGKYDNNDKSYITNIATSGSSTIYGKIIDKILLK